MTAPVHGSVAKGYERLATAFAAAFEGRPSMGAALAIRLDGNPVVDLYGGVADDRTGAPWTPQTSSVIFSCSKGLMSILLARLWQEGRLDYEAPVAQYWPEFAAAGKADITVRQLVAHKAGLSAPMVDWVRGDVLDWNAATRLLAAQSPLWDVGTAYAYHAITHGWLTGELVRRITGISAGAYLAELMARPLSISAWLGLPDEHSGSVAHLQVSPELAALWDKEAARQIPERPNWTLRAMTLGKALPAALATPVDGFNDAEVRRAEIPGAGAVATAGALADIWSATVVDTRGIRLLRPETIRHVSITETSGPPLFDAQPPFARWGLGFQLDSEARRYFGSASLGHDGAGGQVAFADPSARLGFAFVTNWMEAGDDKRATSIIDVLREIVPAERMALPA